MSLQSPEIEPAAPEQRARELLDEFIRGWFLGGPQLIQGRSVFFPECNVAFNQTKPKGDKPIIHFAFADGKTFTEWWGEGLYISRPLLLHVTARVQPQGDNLERADHLAGTVADLLALLIQTPSLRAPLARKGILNARVVRPPVAQQFPGFQCRFLIIGCKLRYYIEG